MYECTNTKVSSGRSGKVSINDEGDRENWVWRHWSIPSRTDKNTYNTDQEVESCLFCDIAQRGGAGVRSGDDGVDADDS